MLRASSAQRMLWALRCASWTSYSAECITGAMRAVGAVLRQLDLIQC